ncbi:LINE-1 retrotransposable element ORF2 protein [Chionoecetes opilio]|uniref:LINE-1 retrotransposable element ORF2 protein n=1 Tax=Chionoecetes opilio TaxID=41210 RepID=A0A8J8WBM2_CHIOP|nr:LINE-1 retrotransposable element ORF2 protein [Chionoecetes opilio]
MNSRVSNRKAIVTFVDLEKAFELANPTAILATLAGKGVKGKLLTWTMDFITEREGRVRFQGHYSDYKTFKNGTQQGSILSPYLFNTLIEILVSLPLGDGCTILGYADDLAVITTGPHYLRKAQNTLSTLDSKCQELGLKINFAKTRTIHFGSNKQAPTISRRNKH